MPQSPMDFYAERLRRKTADYIREEALGNVCACGEIAEVVCWPNGPDAGNGVRMCRRCVGNIKRQERRAKADEKVCAGDRVRE